MLNLAQLALLALPPHVWHSLDRHTRECVFPPTRGICWLQRRLLWRRRARMAAFLELLKPQSNTSLAPQNTVPHLAASAYRVVRKGEHLVVMVGGWRTGFAHHGIALGPDADGNICVADFSRPGEGLKGNVLRSRSLESFIGSQQVFGVVPYSQNEQERDMAVQRAEALVALQSRGQLEDLAIIPSYHLLGWNCETFVGLCVTGSMLPSEQARRLLDAITHDLSKGRKSFLLQTAEFSSGILVSLGSEVIIMLRKLLGY
jgi:hypothetical protein